MLFLSKNKNVIVIKTVQFRQQQYNAHFFKGLVFSQLVIKTMEVISMIYGYARVSTKTQVKGNSLEEQKRELKQNGCTEIITEQFTGKTTDRPKFNKLIEETLQPGDTLVVCKLDRFARTVTEGIEKVRFLFGKGVKVHVLNVGLLEDTPMGKFFITTLLAVAELERCMIMERTLAGKEIAKTRKGYREGRPPVLRDKIEYAMRMIDEQHYSYRETAKLTGISVSTIVRYRKRIAIA